MNEPVHRDPTPHLPPAQVERLLQETSPYLSCDECFDRLDEHVERVLADPGHVDVAMQVHLAACGACAEEAATLTELVSGTAS